MGASVYANTMSDDAVSALATEHRNFIKNFFKMYDKDNSDSIPIADFGTAVRMCGLNPTEELLQEAKKTADENETGVVKFDDFLKAVVHILHYDSTHEDLKNAFRSFDPANRMFIPAADLRYILTHYGDKLSDEEMNEFMLEAATEMEMDLVRYDDLANKLCAEWLRQ
jgi:Ca2+-binding EF-hand superfamily protein